VGRLGRLSGALRSWAEIGWWGLVSPRLSETTPLVVLQAVVLRAGAGGHEEVLLSVRHDLHGWELPGGTLEPGEDCEDALRRELREETGIDVEVDAHVGDYVRTGFRPHTARVFRCRGSGGRLEASAETPLVRWFPVTRLPGTLFPWYRVPLQDALRRLPSPVERCERQGIAAVIAGMRIDLRMRLSDDRAL